MRPIPVVNDQDEIIGFKEFDAVTPVDIYRVAALWVTDSVGNVLLAQRAASKKKDPCKWGPAVAGTVEKGESYEENIIKETAEEIGLDLSIQDLILGPKVRIVTERANYFGQWYRYVTDRKAEDFILQEEEVEQVCWFSPEQIKRDVTEHPERFIPSTSIWLDKFLP